MKIARLQLISSMVIFGTIGLFVRHIPLPSSVIAFARGLIGTVFLLLVMVLRRKKPNLSLIRPHWLPLILSGAALGANWILLFESYRYTTVAVSTLCYYLAPMFIVLVSPLVLKEKLTARKLICVLVALAGMVCVSGVLSGSTPTLSEITGILLGVGAAALYATVVLLNKKLTAIPGTDRTVSQLFISAVVVLPYILLTENVTDLKPDLTGILLLLVVAVVHTGVAYALYFGSVSALSAHTLAIFSYIDPIVAILLSALFLHEPLSMTCAVGAVLILGSALISELPEKKR